MAAAAGKASITVKTISVVGEQQFLIDTRIIMILYGWNTFYAVIAKGYSAGRSQAERRKKESQRRGETRERNDGLIEWIHISIFSEEVGGDRSPQERNERKGDNEIEKMRQKRQRDRDKNRRGRKRGKDKLRDRNVQREIL